MPEIVPVACKSIGGLFALAGTLKLIKVNDDVHKAMVISIFYCIEQSQL